MMHGIDELERAPPSSGRPGFSNHPEPAAPGCLTPLSFLLADKRSHATRRLDARGTTKARLDREGAPVSQIAKGRDAVPAPPARAVAVVVRNHVAAPDDWQS